MKAKAQVALVFRHRDKALLPVSEIISDAWNRYKVKAASVRNVLSKHPSFVHIERGEWKFLELEEEMKHELR